MGKARWWVCSDCKSLNDLPANRCYKCRVEKPANPRLIDDQYSDVGSTQARVGITVDLSKLAELTSPDPLETARGGGVIEAFHPQDAPSTKTEAPTSRMSDTGWPPSRPDRSTSPRPLRDPTPRSIAEVGNRPWADALPPAPPRPAAPAAPPPDHAAPPPPAAYAATPPPPGPLPHPGLPPPPPGAPPRSAYPPAPGYPRPPGFAPPSGAPGSPHAPHPGAPTWPPAPRPAPPPAAREPEE